MQLSLRNLQLLVLLYDLFFENFVRENSRVFYRFLYHWPHHLPAIYEKAL